MANFSSKTVAPSVDYALLVVRLVIGVLMITHGWPKLMRVLDGDFNFADPIGIGSKASLIFTTLAEFGGSVLLIFGLFSRFAAGSLLFTMLVVIFIVKWAEGLSAMESGLLYGITYLTIFVLGPGKFSLDYRIVDKLLKKYR